MVYSLAVLPSSGLGDKLFVWARCRIFSHLNKARMLAPDWGQFRLGALVRREKDPRFYCGLFKDHPQDIRGIKKLGIQLNLRREPEPLDLAGYRLKDDATDILVEFRNQLDFFKRMSGWNNFILGELRAIIRNNLLQQIDNTPVSDIGIHVRRGDFKEARIERDLLTEGNIRTPISWFVESLEQVRSAAGFIVPAFVVSDGSEKELAELLRMQNVKYFKPKNAIVDLMLLSKAKILLASGGSNFSAWASYLGQMPTISHFHQSLTWFNINNEKGNYVGGFSPDNPSDVFLKQIKDLFRNL
jgi:hypothetical protein